MRRALLLAIVVPLALVAASCGDDNKDTASTRTTTKPTQTTTDAYGNGTTEGRGASTTAPAGKGSTTVSTGDTSLGTVLVDAEGKTLYAFTPDSATKSTCTDGCLQAWPPLTVDSGEPTGDGVDAAMLGTLTRDDGSTQVSYNGHPLYTYAPDTGPGDVTGQGVGGKWYVIGTDGELMK